MAIQAAGNNDGAMSLREKTKLDLDAAARAVALNVGNGPDAQNAKATLVKARAAYDAAIKAEAKLSAKTDPGVLAGQELAASAAAEVTATNASIAKTKSDLATTQASNLKNQPGKAWTWNGKAWVKPDMPKDNKSYTWDDNNGWTLATTADVAQNKDVIPPRPGYAYVWNPLTKLWDRPPKPQGPGYSWDDNDGWFVTDVMPGSTGSTVNAPDTMLAIDTFKNTFALMFGAKEAGQPYVSKLYDLVSGFYKTGSTQEEAMNLAIRQAYNENAIPEFTKRFAGIFSLDAKLRAGEAVTVPTITEFFATEAKMGEVLNAAGLGDLATQDFLGQIIGLNKSVNEVTKLINTTFDSIDNAPKSLKDTMSRYFPSVDRVSLAKAILQGPEGAAALDKKIKGISVLSAAQTQGVGTTLAQASDIAAMGYNYNQALAGFEEVSRLKRGSTLAQIGGTEFTQEQAQSAVFGKSATDLAEIDRLKKLEESRFAGKAGNIGSKAFASQQRAAGLI